MILSILYFSFFFFFNDTATTEIYTLSLHDALPNPITSHTNSRIHVSVGRKAIRARHVAIPRIGTTGTHGVRKGRSRSGRLCRRIHTPPHTSTNASKVPMFTRDRKSVV